MSIIFRLMIDPQNNDQLPTESIAQLEEHCTGIAYVKVRIAVQAFLKRPEKPYVKLRPAYSVKLVFLHVVKGTKIKITAKFRDTEHLRFEDTKRIMSPEKFRVF